MAGRPYRVDYDCDYRQRATTHASQEAALAAAEAAVQSAERNRRPEAFITLAGQGGWATVSRSGLADLRPEWWRA